MVKESSLVQLIGGPLKANSLNGKGAWQIENLRCGDQSTVRRAWFARQQNGPSLFLVSETGSRNKTEPDSYNFLPPKAFRVRAYWARLTASILARAVSRALASGISGNTPCRSAFRLLNLSTPYSRLWRQANRWRASTPGSFPAQQFRHLALELIRSRGGGIGEHDNG